MEKHQPNHHPHNQQPAKAMQQIKAKEDGLLAFGGRPALFYPAVREDPALVGSEGLTSPFPAGRLARGLGTAKFLCGVALALLGGVALYLGGGARASPSWGSGMGVWSGLFALLAGLCLLLAARRHTEDPKSTPDPPRPALVFALLVLGVLGFFNTGLLATFTAMGLVAEVYMEEVSGSLVWRGVANASPFTVQLLLLATATADCLLSLACCVAAGRRACRCCTASNRRDKELRQQQARQDRLITWLGSQQQRGPPKLAHGLPPVRLVPSVRRGVQSRPRTPSTIRVFPTPPDFDESLLSSVPTTTKLSAPLVGADELGRNQKAHHTRRQRARDPPPVKEPKREEVADQRAVPAPRLDERYLALDRQLSEEFIERSLNFEKGRLATNHL